MQTEGLNPYCNGRWSLTKICVKFGETMYWRLNPYCNGRWSLTRMLEHNEEMMDHVLILIVMEDGH